MPRTISEVEIWSEANPTRHQGGPWADSNESYCEQFINNAGDFAEGFNSAYLAAMASGPLDPDWSTAGTAEIHYWSGAGGDGHDMFQTVHGLLGATTATNDPSGRGYIPDVPTYNARRPAMHYLGHTYRHGSQTLDLSDISGGGVRPLPAAVGVDDMQIMDRSKDSVVAVYNDWFWQEFNYATGPTWLAAIAKAWAASANTPYSDNVWNYRSNLAPAIKNPAYVIDTKNSKLIPVDYRSSATGGGGTPTPPYDDTALKAAIAAIQTTLTNGFTVPSVPGVAIPKK